MIAASVACLFEFCSDTLHFRLNWFIFPLKACTASLCDRPNTPMQLLQVQCALQRLSQTCHCMFSVARPPRSDIVVEFSGFGGLIVLHVSASIHHWLTALFQLQNASDESKYLSCNFLSIVCFVFFVRINTLQSSCLSDLDLMYRCLQLGFSSKRNLLMLKKIFMLK